jgi:catechol 2,3-dioxygenase-like lactoylglutathione lyase family enzyme
MIKARRLRHVCFSTPDPARQAEYYQSIVGLGRVARDSDQLFLATESDELAVILEAGAEAACKRIAFEVAPDIDPVDLRADLSASGIASDIRSDSGPGISRSLVFVDADGTEIELVSGWTASPVKTPVGGIAANRLGHVAMYTADPQRTQKFYSEVLGFRVSDWIEQSFVFMRCGADHHSLNFVAGERRGINHIAFELRDSSHMHRACDLLGRNRMQILWGPVRHGPGHNVAVYHRNPDGQIVEMFFDLDRMTDEELGYFEPQPWHRDRPQRPKVWVGLPRDIWGLPPAPELTEFRRKNT